MLSFSPIGPFLNAHLSPGSRLLVAVSGGADSVALLHLLKSHAYSLVVGHVDHALRASSRVDARFVQRLGKSWNIPVLVKRQNVRAHARTHRMSLEEAARAVRYDALLEMAKQTRSSAVITAHTQDDQAETVLMNFLRGAGPAGLAGIPPSRPLRKGSRIQVLRPLLGASKKDILGYIKTNALAFREDPTNASLQFARNRIRHVTFPYLEKEYPGLQGRLAQTADIFREEEDFWAAQIQRSQTVVLRGLFGYHKALVRRILRHLLPGSTFLDIEQVVRLARSAKKTSSLELSSGWRVRCRKGALHFKYMRMR